MEQLLCRSIRKTFKNQLVLKGVDLELNQGEITGIVGRNGAGKTVLFKIICGIYRMDSGEIILDGKTMHPGDIRSIGAIIEEPAFFENESGINNLEYLYMIRNKRNRCYLENVMRQVGLDPNNKKNVEKYSLGMRQRLALAQAIMENPDLLVLDEPFNGLDNEGVEEMRKLLCGLKSEGKIILVASHNPEDIRLLCDTVYEMDAGILTKNR